MRPATTFFFIQVSNTREKRCFLNAIETYKVQGENMVSIKHQLLKLAITYKEGYISQSYFFYL